MQSKVTTILRVNPGDRLICNQDGRELLVLQVYPHYAEVRNVATERVTALRLDRIRDWKNGYRRAEC